MMFCINRNTLRNLVENEIKGLVDREIVNFIARGGSIEEMLQQQISERGAFNDAIALAIKKFNHRTANVEVQMALELSEIYDLGPKEEIIICFEMKNDFNGKVFTLDNLVKNIDSDTHIDCIIRYKRTEARFQIKRYPSEYLVFSTKGMIDYLKKIMAKYAKMSDINLIILLQPRLEAARTPLDFQMIHDSLTSMIENISLGEISFLFNANMQELTLFRVFPELKMKSIPLLLRSPKYQELQKRWAAEMGTQRTRKSFSL